MVVGNDLSSVWEAEMLQQLAAVMGCCKDELPNRQGTILQGTGGEGNTF